MSWPEALSLTEHKKLLKVKYSDVYPKKGTHYPLLSS